MEPGQGISLVAGTAARAENEGRRREWLLAPMDIPSPSSETDIERQVRSAPRVVLAKERLREDARLVYREPEHASDRVVSVAEVTESNDALYLDILERPERFGALLGEQSRLFGRPSRARREALAALGRLARDASDIVLAEQSVRRDVERLARDEARRMSIGIPAPSVELAQVLDMGKAGAAVIAAHRPLLDELRRLGLALTVRLSADEDRAALRSGELQALAQRHRIKDEEAAALARIASQVIETTAAVREQIVAARAEANLRR